MGRVRQEAAERVEAEDAQELVRARQAWNREIRRRAERLAQMADLLLSLPVVRQTIDDGKTVVEPLSASHLRAAAAALRDADALARLSFADGDALHAAAREDALWGW